MSGQHWSGDARTFAAVIVGLLFVMVPIFGDRVQKAWASRRLRRHYCPAPCEESRRCLCGCGGLHSVGERQEKCAVCGAPIVVDDEEPDVFYSSGEITAELPAPKGFTSWGWERDREFRRARQARTDWEDREARRHRGEE